MTIPTLDKIELVSLVIVIGLMVVAAQRYVANKRLANRRRNPED